MAQSCPSWSGLPVFGKAHRALLGRRACVDQIPYPLRKRRIFALMHKHFVQNDQDVVDQVFRLRLVTMAVDNKVLAETLDIRSPLDHAAVP